MSFGSENPAGHFGSVDGAGTGGAGPWPGFGAGTSDVQATSGDGVSALAARVDHFHKGVHSVNGAFGDVTVVAFPGFAVAAPPNVASASALGVGATAAHGDHTHGLDLVAYTASLAAMQHTGVVQQTFGAGVATPSTLTMVAAQVPYGDATPGLLTQNAFLTFAATASAGTLTVGGNSAGTFTAYIANNTGGGGARFRMNRSGVSGVTFEIVSATAARIIMNDATLTTFQIVGNASLNSNCLNSAVQDGDTAIGVTNTNFTPASIVGFPWVPGANGAPAGVPTHVGDNFFGSQGNPYCYDQAHRRWYVYDRVGPGWHFTQLMDYDPTATRVPFGGAATHSLTDNANFTYTTASQTLTLTGTGGLTEAPLVLAVGDTSGRALHLTTGATTITADAALFMAPGTTFSAGGAGSTDFQIDANHNLALGFQNTLVTTATNGFPFMRTTAGAPTGVPAASYLASGMAPFLYDTTNHKFWVYDGLAAAWKGILLL